MEATIHLMSSPANARRLTRSIRSLDRGEAVEHVLIEPEAKLRRIRRTFK